MNLGRIGIWRSRRHGTQGLDELETLGYSTFWLGGSPSTTLVDLPPVFIPEVRVSGE